MFKTTADKLAFLIIVSPLVMLTVFYTLGGGFDV